MQKNVLATELFHEWSKSQKAAYNREYYLRNKDKWKKYYDSDDVASMDTNYRKLGDKAYKDEWDAYGKAQVYRENARREREEQSQLAKRATEAKNRGDYDEYKRLSKQYWDLEKSIKGWKNDADKQQRRSEARGMDREMYNQMIDFREQQAANRTPQAMATKTVKGTVKNMLRKAKKASSVIGSKACKAGKSFFDTWKAGL